MAAVLISSRRVERGIMECERALSLNPSLASAHAMLGLAKYLLGQGEETESHVEEALRLSPLDTFAYLWMLFAGVATIQIGRVWQGNRVAEAQYRHKYELSLGSFPSGGCVAVNWKGGRSAGGNASRAFA